MGSIKFPIDSLVTPRISINQRERQQKRATFFNRVCFVLSLFIPALGRPPFPVPTSIARAFVHELDLSTRAPISALLELLLRRASEDSVSDSIEMMGSKTAASIPCIDSRAFIVLAPASPKRVLLLCSRRPSSYTLFQGDPYAEGARTSSLWLMAVITSLLLPLALPAKENSKLHSKALVYRLSFSPPFLACPSGCWALRKIAQARILLN